MRLLPGPIWDGASISGEPMIAMPEDDLLVSESDASAGDQLFVAQLFVMARDRHSGREAYLHSVQCSIRLQDSGDTPRTVGQVCTACRRIVAACQTTILGLKLQRLWKIIYM